MDAIKSIILLGTVALVAGCAAHPEPIIDMKGVDQRQFVQDWNECEGYSEEVQMSKGIARGAGLGAAIGAVTGAISGDSSVVAESAAYGGLYGGVDSGLQADHEKQEVFKRCMAGRGYRVLN